MSAPQLFTVVRCAACDRTITWGLHDWKFGARIGTYLHRACAQMPV
jgi:hypothetical protein